MTILKWIKEKFLEQDLIYKEFLERTQLILKNLKQSYPEHDFSFRIRFYKWEWLEGQTIIEFFKVRDKYYESIGQFIPCEDQSVIFRYDCYDPHNTFVPPSIKEVFDLLQKEDVLTNYWLSMVDMTCAYHAQFSITDKAYEREIYQAVKEKNLFNPKKSRKRINQAFEKLE